MWFKSITLVAGVGKKIPEPHRNTDSSHQLVKVIFSKDLLYTVWWSTKQLKTLQSNCQLYSPFFRLLETGKCAGSLLLFFQNKPGWAMPRVSYQYTVKYDKRSVSNPMTAQYSFSIVCLMLRWSNHQIKWQHWWFKTSSFKTGNKIE